MTDDIRKELGLVHIYTGNGKGKTTAALGQSLRAAGRGLNVLFFQFLKPDAGYGEQKMCGCIDNITIVSMGVAHFIGNNPKPEDFEMAMKALSTSEEMIATGKYDVVVLDEAMNAVRLGLISSKDLIDSLRRRPEHVEVILTGRGMTPELEEYADLITEMKLIKHPMDSGVGARKGIEY